jgi:hypothetical protein
LNSPSLNSHPAPMKRLRTLPTLVCLATGLTLPSALLADTIIMKDGKKYENAKVLSETADAISFDYVVVGQIHDQRTEAKTGVAQVIRQRPEEMEWKELKSKLTLPMPDMTPADQYESTIQDALRPFLTKFPGTAEAKEVEGIIKELQEEKEKVVSGAIKMEGAWLTPELAKRDARNLEAYQKRAEITTFLAEGKTVEALNKWEVFKSGEDGYSDTLQFVKAVPQITDTLTKYDKLLRQMISEQPILQRRRDDSIKGLVEPDLSRVKRAVENEVSQFKLASDEAKQMRYEWAPTYKYDIKSLQGELKKVLTEKAFINGLNLAELQKENEDITAARHYIADKNLEKAEEALGRVGKSSKNNRDSSRHITALKSELGKLKAEASRNKAKQRIYGDTSAASVKKVTADTDRIAEAEAAAKQGKDAESAVVDKASKLASSFGAGSSSKDKVKSETEEKPKSKPKYNAVKDEVEEDSTFSTILKFGGIPLLIILGVFMFMQQKKKKADA